MRDIRFRGQRIDNGEWVYGDLLQPKSINYIGTIWIDTGDGFKYQVIPETVGQFTGREVNAQEFYEGDIIAFAVFDYNGSDTQYKGVIKWSDTRFEIWHDSEQPYYGSDGAFDLGWALSQHDEPEVIGNVHTNPELLEVQQ